MEETVLLKQFILNSKATNAEHIRAIQWLNLIHQKYKQEISELQVKNE